MYAFGRKPATDELNYWAGQNNTYKEMVKNHVQWMASNRQEWDNTIMRAYIYVFNAAPGTNDLNNWKAKKPIAFSSLANQLEKELAANPTRKKSYRVQGVQEVNVASSKLQIPAELKKDASELLNDDAIIIVN